MIETTRATTRGATQAWMEGNPDPPVLSSGPLGWNGLIAERDRHAPGGHQFPALAEDTASVYLGQPVRSVRWSADGIHEGPTSNGDVMVKVAGQEHGVDLRTVELDAADAATHGVHPAGYVLCGTP